MITLACCVVILWERSRVHIARTAFVLDVFLLASTLAALLWQDKVL